MEGKKLSVDENYFYSEMHSDDSYPGLRELNQNRYISVIIGIFATHGNLVSSLLKDSVAQVFHVIAS